MKWIRQTLVLVVSSIIANYSVAVSYGPSLLSLTKYNKDVNGPTIFHPETGRLLHLGDYPNFSVTVPLALDSPTATSNQVFISRRISGPGEFLVEAPPGHGVMVVIQSMDLRVASTGCNDFIQFGEVDGVETTGTCGKVDNRDGSLNPPELIGPRVFRSPSGKMRVLFYHGYIWGLVRDFNFDLLDPSRNPVLRVELVFTAYKECDVYKTSQTDYRPCSNSLYSTTCISSNLFCDRVLNCGFDSDFGSDELISSCFPQLYQTFVPIHHHHHAQLQPVLDVQQAFPEFQPSTTTSTTTTTTRAPTTVSSTTTQATTTTIRSTTTTPTTTKATTTTTTTEIPTSTSTTTPTTTTALPPSTTSTTRIPLALTTQRSPGILASFTHRLREHFFAGAYPEILEAEDPIEDLPPPTTSSTTTNAPSTSPPIIIDFNRSGKSIEPQEANDKKGSLSQEETSRSNMTFIESHNDLSADIGEEKVELLENLPGTTLDAPDLGLEDDDESTSNVLVGLGILTVLAVGLLVCLRIYCCHHTVIWIPNPNNMRRRRKRGESSIYETESGVSPDDLDKDFPKKKSQKETPPSYDALFPKPSDQKICEDDDGSLY